MIRNNMLVDKNPQKKPKLLLRKLNKGGIKMPRIHDKNFLVFQMEKNLTTEKFIELNKELQIIVKDFGKDYLQTTYAKDGTLMAVCKDPKKVTDLEIKEKLNLEKDLIFIIDEEDFKIIKEGIGEDNVVFFRTLFKIPKI